MLDKFIDKIPEQDREAYKQAIANAVIISNREDAGKLIAENQYLKSERDAIISRTTDNYAQKFREEKLPGIMQEELKRLNPPKDAKDQALADMQSKLAKMERDALLKDRTTVAMQKLSEIGLPANLAKFAIDEDENVFASKIEELSGLKAWRDMEIERITKEKFGNQKPPVGGSSSGAGFDKMTQTELNQYAMQGPDQKAAVLAWVKQRK